MNISPKETSKEHVWKQERGYPVQPQDSNVGSSDIHVVDFPFLVLQPHSSNPQMAPALCSELAHYSSTPGPLASVTTLIGQNFQE